MSTRSDDEIVARLRASLDELSAGIPARPHPWTTGATTPPRSHR